MKIYISLLLFSVLMLCNNAFAQSGGRSTNIVNISGKSFYVHTIEKSETLYSLSKLYQTDQSVIVEVNPSSAGVLSIGMTIKVPFVEPEYSKREQRKRSRKFVEHDVVRGETAYSIARLYGLPVDVLVDNNPMIDFINLPIGVVLNILKDEIGESSSVEIHKLLIEYSESINRVSDEYLYHVVAKDDTFYKLSKRYAITVDKLKSLNNILDNNLRLGAILKVGEVESALEQEVLKDTKKIKTSALFPDYRNIAEVVIDNDGLLDIALFLPILDERQGKPFVEFYQGVLLAIESFKEVGESVNLRVFNSSKSAENVLALISAGELDGVDLIVGPIYEEVAVAVVEYAEANNIPVVSPLATFDAISSQILYQLSPVEDTQYEKLIPLLSNQENNIIVITADENDTEFQVAVNSMLPPMVKRFKYHKKLDWKETAKLLSADSSNILVVLASDSYIVDEILAGFSSIQNNILARSIRLGDIETVGTSKWLRFSNIDRELFFKLDLRIVSGYFADSTNELVRSFDKRYIEAFSALPTLFSYRGYDAVKLFGSVLINDYNLGLSSALEVSNPDLLQAVYKFESKKLGANVNTNWSLIKYNNDYSIVVE